MIVELQMRYIDQIHFAKNDLIKDKQIIKRYLTSLQRVSSGASMESLQEEIKDNLLVPSEQLKNTHQDKDTRLLQTTQTTNQSKSMLNTKSSNHTSNL